MYPELFTIPIPAFLRDLLAFLPETVTIQAYGSMIALGVVAAFYYSRNESRKLGVDQSKMIDLFIWVFIAAYVGGRFFLFFERPEYYFGDPSNMLDISGSGFVFYGSLIFAIPVMILFFRYHKWPVPKMIDAMAPVAVLVHLFGRMGCFMAGCCHGVPTDSFLGVTFTHHASAADPLGMSLHPTQLYSVFMLLMIFVVLRLVKSRKRFEGQLFLLYIILYAAGRSIIEEFRGDEARGFVFEGFLSHSQLISLIAGLTALGIYLFLMKKSRSPEPSNEKVVR